MTKTDPYPYSELEKCVKCGHRFDPSDHSYDGMARQRQTPFCRGCVAACHDTEIADHWCQVDEWRAGE